MGTMEKSTQSQHLNTAKHSLTNLIIWILVTSIRLELKWLGKIDVGTKASTRRKGF